MMTPTTAVPVAPKKLRGIIPPMITPLRGRDALDEAGLEKLLEHIIAGGVSGLFILGTSGEGPSLSYRLRRELIERVCRQVRGRLPVLVGITDTSVVESLALAQHAASHGATAVVTAAPFYLPAGQPELIEYVEHLCRELPLPLYLYNMPQLTKVQFEPETLRRLTPVKQIAGLKDSSGNLEYFDKLIELKRERPDWTVLTGPEHLTAETMRRGGDGGVNGGANFHPKLFVDLFNAVESGDVKRSDELQRQLVQLGGIYSIGKHASAVIKGMKCACWTMGLCSDFMAEPFVSFHETERARVRTILQSVGLKTIR